MSKNLEKALENSPALSHISFTGDRTERAPEPQRGPIKNDTELESFVSQHKDEIQQLLQPERKSRKVNSLIKPSIYEGLKARAEETGDSVNNVINDLLERALEEIKKK